MSKVQDTRYTFNPSLCSQFLPALWDKARTTATSHHEDRNPQHIVPVSLLSGPGAGYHLNRGINEKPLIPSWAFL